MIILYVKRMQNKRDKMTKYFIVTDKKVSYNQNGLLKKITNIITENELDRNTNKTNFVWTYEPPVKKKL